MSCCHILGICNHLYRVGPYLGQCKCYAPIYRTDHIVPKNFNDTYLFKLLQLADIYKHQDLFSSDLPHSIQQSNISTAENYQFHNNHYWLAMHTYMVVNSVQRCTWKWLRMADGSKWLAAGNGWRCSTLQLSSSLPKLLNKHQEAKITQCQCCHRFINSNENFSAFLLIILFSFLLSPTR